MDDQQHADVRVTPLLGIIYTHERSHIFVDRLAPCACNKILILHVWDNPDWFNAELAEVIVPCSHR